MRGKDKMTKKLSQPRGMKQLYALGEQRPIDLSLSENPLGCSLRVVSALKSMEIKFNDYPTPNGGLLKKKLAQKFKLSEANFLVANGSESIINDLPRVFGQVGDEVIIPALSFPMFSICSELAGKKPILAAMTEELGIDLAKMSKLITSKTRLVFICNPNNPTGSVLSKKELIKFLNNVPERILVIVDEANIEFGGQSIIDEVSKRSNLIVLRTFSKGFGLASLRIGFGVANKKIIQKLEEETPVFPISSLSEQLAMIALEDDNFINFTQKFVSEQRQLLVTGLEKLVFQVFPSQANNLFVKAPASLSAEQLVSQLKQQGISLVMGSSFDGWDDSFFRVSVRDEKTNWEFLEKMGEIAIQ